MSHYKTSTTGVAITALNILDGLDHHKHWDLLQPAWEEEGYGFIEFCGWISELAEISEKLLESRDVDSFPGVYDYEVSCEIGEQIAQFVISNNKLPTTEEVTRWINIQADVFFGKDE